MQRGPDRTPCPVMAFCYLSGFESALSKKNKEQSQRYEDGSVEHCTNVAKHSLTLYHSKVNTSINKLYFYT